MRTIDRTENVTGDAMLQREDGSGLHHPAPLLAGLLRIANLLLRRFEFPAASKEVLSRGRSAQGGVRGASRDGRARRLVGGQRRRRGGTPHQRPDGRSLLPSLDEVGHS